MFYTVFISNVWMSVQNILCDGVSYLYDTWSFQAPKLPQDWGKGIRPNEQWTQEGLYPLESQLWRGHHLLSCLCVVDCAEWQVSSEFLCIWDHCGTAWMDTIREQHHQHQIILWMFESPWRFWRLTCSWEQNGSGSQGQNCEALATAQVD